MGKNGNGEGNVRQRSDGRWEARYCVETPEGLKRRSVYGKTRKEVAEKLAVKLANKDTEPVQEVEQTTITARDYFAEYLAAMKDTLKRRSYETNNDIIRLHLNPEFGGMNLTNLNRKGIQSMYARKRESLSAARVKRIHSVLAASLNMAVRWGYLDKNPCDAVSKPKVPAPEIRPFSKEEAKRFIAAASGERYEALFVLGLTSGARWGELAGLQWRDLNIDGRVMHIQRALVNGYGGHTFDTPKTSGSRRSVGLTALATDALARHRDRMREEGHRIDGDALVFVNTLGKPLHSSNFIRRCFKPLLKRAGLPDTNWHAATRLAELVARATKYATQHSVTFVPSENPTIGCIVLEDPVFYSESEFFKPEQYGLPFPDQVVKYKYFPDVDSIEGGPASDGHSADFQLVDEISGDYRPSWVKDRPGQATFRQRVLAAYGFRCCVTGEATEEVLDAAHIQPYVNKESDHVQNGLPLRADFHRLFDAGLITVDDDYRVVLGDHLESVTYASYDGRQILMPHEPADNPSREALKVHRGLVFRA